MKHACFSDVLLDRPEALPTAGTAVAPRAHVTCNTRVCMCAAVLCCIYCCCVLRRYKADPQLVQAVLSVVCLPEVVEAQGSAGIEAFAEHPVWFGRRR